MKFSRFESVRSKEKHATLDLFYRGKLCIEENEFQRLQRLFTHYLSLEYETGDEPDTLFLFRKLYLYACELRRPAIANWLMSSLYMNLDVAQQTSVRHVFPYGRYLMSKL